MSYFTPWSNFWRKNSLIPSALFLFQIFIKAMQLGCKLILITALVTCVTWLVTHMKCHVLRDLSSILLYSSVIGRTMSSARMLEVKS